MSFKFQINSEISNCNDVHSRLAPFSPFPWIGPAASPLGSMDSTLGFQTCLAQSVQQTPRLPQVALCMLPLLDVSSSRGQDADHLLHVPVPLMCHQPFQVTCLTPHITRSCHFPTKSLSHQPSMASVLFPDPKTSCSHSSSALPLISWGRT